MTVVTLGEASASPRSITIEATKVHLVEVVMRDRKVWISVNGNMFEVSSGCQYIIVRESEPDGPNGKAL